MSGKGPRRPKNQSGPARSSAAWAASAQAFQDPAKVSALTSLLGGHFIAGTVPGVASTPTSALPETAAAAAARAGDNENMIPMLLRNVRKSNTTTKAKALSELAATIPACSDERLAPLLINIAETVRSHVFHEDAQVRSHVFRVLGATITALGPQSKRALLAELPQLAGPWLAGCGDIEASVRDAAKAALDAAFKDDEKLRQMLGKFKGEAREFFLLAIEDVTGGPKGAPSSSGRARGEGAGKGGVLSDDILDPRANVLCGCLSGLGTLAARLSGAAEDQAFVAKELLSLIDDAPQSALGPIAPHATKLLGKTPRVRAAYLNFLVSVVGINHGIPFGRTAHGVVGRAVTAAIADPHAAVAGAAWPLLLQWLRRHGADALAAMPPGFFDKVILVLEGCQDAQRLRIIFDSLMPLVALASSSRTSRSSAAATSTAVETPGGSTGPAAAAAAALDLVDDFMETIIEKVRALHALVCAGAASTSGSTRMVMELLVGAWGCAGEMWELLALRKVDAGEPGDCLEALAVLLEVMVEHNLEMPSDAPAAATQHTEGGGGAVAQEKGKEEEGGKCPHLQQPRPRRVLDDATMDAIVGRLSARLLQVVEKRPAISAALWEKIAARPRDDTALVAAERALQRQRFARCVIAAPAAAGLLSAVIAELVEARQLDALAQLLRGADADAAAGNVAAGVVPPRRRRLSGSAAGLRSPTEFAVPPCVLSPEVAEVVISELVREAPALSADSAETLVGVLAASRCGGSAVATLLRHLAGVLAASSSSSSSAGATAATSLHASAGASGVLPGVAILLRALGHVSVLEHAAAAGHDAQAARADVWQIARSLAQLPAPARFSAWFTAAVDARVLPSSSALDAVLTTVAETVGSLPPPLQLDITGRSGMGGAEPTDSSGMYDSDDDLETATTFTSSGAGGGANRGNELARHLQGWIEILGGAHLTALLGIGPHNTFATQPPLVTEGETQEEAEAGAAVASFPELRPLVVQIAQRCVIQALHLSPNVAPEHFASQKLLGLVLRADGGNQHRSRTLAFLRAKQHAASTERIVELADGLAAALSALGCSLDDVMSDVEHTVVSPNGPIVAVSTSLAFMTLGPHQLSVLVSADVWRALLADLEHAHTAATTAMPGGGGGVAAVERRLERRVAVFGGEHEFAEISLTVAAAGAAIRLGLLLAVLAELHHATGSEGGGGRSAEDGGWCSAVRFKAPDGTVPTDDSDARVVPLAFQAQLLRVATFAHVLSDRARGALHTLLRGLFASIVTHNKARALLAYLDEFSLIAAAANAAASGQRLAVSMLQDAIAVVALTDLEKQRSKPWIAAAVSALEIMERNFEVSSSSGGGVAPPALQLSRDHEVAARQAVADGVRRSGASFEWLRLVVLILRRQSRAHVLPDECVIALIESAVAEKSDTTGALVLLSELSKATIMNVAVYTELCSALKHVSAQCCQLHHLPSNGRLGQRIPSARPLPVYALREHPLAMIRTYEGLQANAREDDVLLSSINLVVFDTICEAVTRLKGTSDADVAPLVQLIAQLTPHVSRLRSHETRTLSASEQSLGVIASVLGYTHMWLATCSIAKIESLGIDCICQVICCVNELAAVTLIATKAPCQDAVVTVTTRSPVRSIRAPDALLEPMKMQTLLTLSAAIERSSKQKLCLFTYLMAWASLVTSAKGEAGNLRNLAPRELQQRLFPLLDIIAALALSRMDSGDAANGGDGGGAVAEGAESGVSAAASGGSPLGGSSSGGSLMRRLEQSHFSTFAADQLGFEIRALGRIVRGDSLAASAAMARALAHGALSVLTFLLQSPVTANSVRNWIESLDRVLQRRIEMYIRTHVAPALIQNSLAEVLAESPEGKPTFALDECVTVCVNVEARTVEVTFTQEEATVGVKLVLPELYPLQHPEIAKESVKIKVKGVEMDKWRSWMLKITTMLVNGGSTLWQCVRLFADNVTKHYEGVEPCPICYAVIAQNGHRLPDMACSICRNKFHSTCLYTWWGSSGNATCPMCRSPWYSK